MTNTYKTYEVPLKNSENQILTISLNNAAYKLTFKWVNAPDAGWVVDIADINDNPIAAGLPLVTGTDLLGQLQYLGIGGSLLVQTDHDPDTVPTFDNLGQTSHLYYLLAQNA